MHEDDLAALEEDYLSEEWWNAGAPSRREMVREMLRGRPPEEAAPLTVAQAARVAGVGAKTIYRALADGRLAAAWKVGNRWKIPAAALDGLRERPERPPTAPSRRRQRPATPRAHGDHWEP